MSLFTKSQPSPLDKLINAMERHVKVHGESLTADVLFRREVTDLTNDLAALLTKSSSLPTHKLDEIRKQLLEFRAVVKAVRQSEEI